MNFFAHLVLADANMHSRVGNLLGDFAKGIDVDQLHPELQRGLINHRRVDHFTDHHPIVRQMKRSFSGQRRRFSGIALDVLFDHLLLKQWQNLSETPKAEVIASLYLDLERGQPLMPAQMQLVTTRLVEHDWFSSYESLDGVAYALERIASRIRFQHNFYGIGEELEQHYQQFDRDFQLFITDLFREFPSPLINENSSLLQSAD